MGKRSKSNEKRFKFKHIILIIALILLTLSVYIISQTYSKYISTAGSQSEMTIAKWHILVNNTHITSGTNISNTIQPTFPGNTHIKQGIIAPTAEGYFDLNLDFVEVDVSFKYEITINVNADSAVSDMAITGYSFDQGLNITSFTPGNTKIEETILLNSSIDNRDIRIYIEWNDDDLTETMDNAADTLTTTDPLNRALVDVSVAFTQIV